jgi:hypothetical protein
MEVSAGTCIAVGVGVGGGLIHTGPDQGQRQVRFHRPENLNLQVFLANVGINLNLT